MPFIVTTTRHLPSMESYDTLEHVERRAVATLEEAQDAAQDRLQVENGAPPIHSLAVYDALCDQVLAISESGGTVGPLPDGTLIEVEQVGYVQIRARTGLPFDDRAEAEIIAAYNAKHGSA